MGESLLSVVWFVASPSMRRSRFEVFGENRVRGAIDRAGHKAAAAVPTCYARAVTTFAAHGMANPWAVLNGSIAFTTA